MEEKKDNILSENEVIDVLFLHIPKFSSYYKPFDEYMFINFISMGLFALADLVYKAGFKTQIVHLGVEWICDNKFSIVEYVKKTKPKIIAAPIFWHPQTYDVVNVIRKIKKQNPNIYIITGGFTASYFKDEILNEVSEIDALIHGHGEASIVPLIQKVIDNVDENKRYLINLENIPNLIWRKYNKDGSNTIIDNSEVFFATNEDLDRLNFNNISLLKNYETYRCSFRLNVAYSKVISREENLRITPVQPYHLPLFIGRGCPVECKLCAGRNKNQVKMNHFGKVIFRSIDKVCDSILEIKEYGFNQVIVCTDPYPHNPEYFIKLFKRIRERKIEIDMFFESWGLPTIEFIEEFGKTFFGRNSAIAISAESGNEIVRSKIRGYHFTNEQLFKTLDMLEENHVGFLVFFTIGNPFETEKDLDQTFELICKIKENYNFIRWLTTYPVQIEPGSAIFEEPEKYNVEKLLYTFKDYYEFHGRNDSCLYTNLGYYIKGYFDNEPEFKSKIEKINWFSDKISKLRCERFCILHPDPEVARHYCQKQHDYYVSLGYGSFEKFQRSEFN